MYYFFKTFSTNHFYVRISAFLNPLSIIFHLNQGEVTEASPDKMNSSVRLRTALPELTSQVHFSDLIHSNEWQAMNLDGKVTQLPFAFLTI